jgi:hypothetical protein
MLQQGLNIVAFYGESTTESAAKLFSFLTIKSFALGITLIQMLAEGLEIKQFLADLALDNELALPVMGDQILIRFEISEAKRAFIVEIFQILGQSHDSGQPFHNLLVVLGGPLGSAERAFLLLMVVAPVADTLSAEDVGTTLAVVRVSSDGVPADGALKIASLSDIEIHNGVDQLRAKLGRNRRIRLG